MKDFKHFYFGLGVFNILTLCALHLIVPGTIPVITLGFILGLLVMIMIDDSDELLKYYKQKRNGEQK